MKKQKELHKLFVIGFLVLGLVVISGQLLVARDNVVEVNGGRLEDWSGYKVLFLSGSPYERGYQHGRLVSQEIVLMVDTIKLMLTWKEKGWLTQVITGLEQQLLPCEIEEMQGVAAGAGLDYEEILLINMTWELFSGCSQIAFIDEEGRMMVGRNLDYHNAEQLRQGLLVTVVFPEEGLPYFAPGFAGMVGTFTGVNSEGIYVAMNASSAELCLAGVPAVFFQRRLLLNCTTSEQLHQQVEEMPATSGYNLMVAAAEEGFIGVLEVAPPRKEWRYPDTDYVVTTNHFEHPRMQPLEVFSMADWRQELLASQLQAGGEPSLAWGREILTTVVPDETYAADTMQSIVWLPGEDQFWLAMGQLPATDGEFILFNPLDLLGTN